MDWPRLFQVSERALFRARTRQAMRERSLPDMFVDSSPLTDEVVSTYMENPPSFGHEFNLIRAVDEYGPQRIATITKTLADLEAEMASLREERATLEQLVAVVQPST